MHKTHLEQLKIFPATESAAAEINNFVIMKFAQCGNYPKILPGGNYIAVIWKELIETSYEPPKLEFINDNRGVGPEALPSQPIRTSVASVILNYFTPKIKQK